MRALKPTYCFLLFTALASLCFAQTPYDSFAPETSRPMLEADALYEEIVQENRQVDTILCAALIDMHSQSLYLVSLTDGTILASAPLTDDLRKWLSVDPLVDKYIYASPYIYCNGNPIKYVDPNGEGPLAYAFAITAYYVSAHLMENSVGNSNVRTVGYSMMHPINAYRVGMYSENGHNISSIAGNFTINLMRAAGLSYQKEGDAGNAFRHALWQAIIANNLGENQALRIGNAHEPQSTYDTSVIFGISDDFDTATDLRNNEIGRTIGAGFKGTSNKKLAGTVLREFLENGLWVTSTQTDGTRIVQKVCITQQQYDKALEELNKKGEDGLNVK